MTQLEKYCFAYNPKGEAVKVHDPTHWDDGKWVIPSSFDKLISDHWPAECSNTGGPLAVTRVLSNVARFFHPDICEATGKCSESSICSDDDQCKSTKPKASPAPCPDTVVRVPPPTEIKDIIKNVLKGPMANVNVTSVGGMANCTGAACAA